MAEGKRRLAVLVGCNYPNTRNELHGCINDVLAMKEVLLNRFGFDLANVEVLTDGQPESSEVMPTGANIKAALLRMVDKAEAGDVLFFHYSGHGTRIPSQKRGHHFRQDEAIVPCDFNLITDLDFRELVNRLPEGTSFTMISDSCHSGGLIDKEKEQIGPSSVTRKSEISPNAIAGRTIPFETVLEHLTSKTGINTTEIGTHLLELFGGDAGLNFRLPPTELPWKDKPDAGILLSGCQADETSADMNPAAEDQNGSGGTGKAYGAFTNAIQMVLKENTGDLTNKQLVMMARNVLQRQGFEQHPCLYCSDQNADASFLLQPQS